MNESKYGELIAKIQRKRRTVIIITVIAVLLVILLTSPVKIEIMEKAIIDYKGLHPIITVLLVILCLFVELIAFALVSSPLSTAMDVECDPEKHLLLNIRLNKQKNIDDIYAMDHLFMGNYAAATEYAEKMIGSSDDAMRLAGLFNKARCEFLKGENDALGQTATEYDAALSSCRKLKPKALEGYGIIGRVLLLMVAISKDDMALADELRGEVKPWNSSKATEGYVNYVKGLAAKKVGDREETIYRFKAVKESCSKTCFARLADEGLASLK